MKAQTETYIQTPFPRSATHLIYHYKRIISKRKTLSVALQATKKTARKSEPFNDDIQINTENYPTLPSRLWSNSNSVSFNLYMS